MVFASSPGASVASPVTVGSRSRASLALRRTASGSAPARWMTGRTIPPSRDPRRSHAGLRSPLLLPFPSFPLDNSNSLPPPTRFPPGGSLFAPCYAGGFGCSSNGGHFGGVANLELWTEWQWMTSRDTATQFPF